MRSGKRAFVLTLLVLLFVFGGTMAAGATEPSDEVENEVNEENNNAFPNTSPWLKDTQDDTIYENTVDASEDAQDIKVKKPGRVEKYIAELFRNIGSGVISLLQENVGISLDGIIYGRVGSGQPNKVNIFGFELRKGNPYGVSGAICYSLIRGMAFAFLGIQFTAELAKAAWSGQTAKSREEIKAMFPSMILKFAVLMLMPYLLDVALYARDVVLFGIKEVTGQMITGGASLSMSKAFLMNAERSGTFIDALMYLGTVALTIYFMFLYVALAMDMLICFVSFPVMCMLHSRRRDLLNGWIMTVFSNILTPMIDAMLLLIPLLTSLMLSDTIRGVSIIQLIMCLLIIPARGRMKALLGVQSNERNGFLGAMAMMALARAAVGGVKRGIGKAGEMFGDLKKSRAEGELADIDREEEAYLTGNGGKTERRQNDDNMIGLQADGENNGFMQTSMEESMEEKTGPVGLSASESSGMQYEPDFSVADNSGNETEALVLPEEGGVPGTTEAGIEGSSPERLCSEEIPALDGDERKSRNDMMRDLEAESNQLQANIDALRVERSGAMKEDKRLKREMLDYERNSSEYKDLERAKADNETRVAAIDEQIAGQNRRLNEARRQKERVGAGTKKVPTTFDERRASVMAKRADISNFETPEFRNSLSHAQMQSLYRKRAAANAGKLAVGVGASLGAGAAMGGAAAFMGPSAAAMAVAGGMAAGGAVGEAAVDGAVSIGRTAGRVFKSAEALGSQVSTQAVMDYVRPAAASVDVSWSDPTDLRPEGEVATEEILQPQQTLSIQEIRSDASLAFSKVFDVEGNMKNSSALRALKDANLNVEKYIACMKEEGTQLLTREMELEKRIELQTEFLAKEVMMQMEDQGYQRGMPGYETAKEHILGKTREIMERNNRPL